MSVWQGASGKYYCKIAGRPSVVCKGPDQPTGADCNPLPPSGDNQGCAYNGMVGTVTKPLTVIARGGAGISARFKKRKIAAGFRNAVASIPGAGPDAIKAFKFLQDADLSGSRYSDNPNEAVTMDMVPVSFKKGDIILGQMGPVPGCLPNNPCPPQTILAKIPTKDNVGIRVFIPANIVEETVMAKPLFENQPIVEGDMPGQGTIPAPVSGSGMSKYITPKNMLYAGVALAALYLISRKKSA